MSAFEAMAGKSFQDVLADIEASRVEREAHLLTPEGQAEEAARLREQAEEDRLDRLTYRSSAIARLRGTGVRLAAGDYGAIIDGELAERDALTRARAWHEAAGDGSILVMLGGTGTGKSVAAASLFVSTTGPEYGYWNVAGNACTSDEMSRLASSGWSDDVAQFKKAMSLNGLLVVDDVGTERDASKARHMLFELVNARQSIGQTVLTCNLTAEGLKQRVCERTLSRLRACGKVISVKGTDGRAA